MFLVKPIKTRVFLPPKDDLFSLIKESIFDLKEKSILVFTSKIVSIWQGRCIKMGLVKDKDELIKKEAQLYFESPGRGGEDSPMLTIKNNTLIPAAGIDESNGNGYYILWPQTPFLAAKKIYQFIKRNYYLKKIGIIISDSHTIPMRRGTVGISIAYWGFEPLKDYRGKKDIFGRKLQITQLNIADSLAATANLVMGEGKEQTPIAIIEDLDFVKFKESSKFREGLGIKTQEDIYGPLISAIKWKSGF
jgi:F420-0:gamma-glutamyl ligase